MATFDPSPSDDLTAVHDALVRLAAVAQQSAEPQSSVQIEQAAKPGLPPRITVKVYAPQPAAAADLAQQLYDQLVARYATVEASA
jgi:hypothetical protein